MTNDDDDQDDEQDDDQDSEQDNHTDDVDSVDSRLLPRPVCSLPCSLVFGEVFLLVHNALLIIILDNVLINTTIMISLWFSRFFKGNTSTKKTLLKIALIVL